MLGKRETQNGARASFGGCSASDAGAERTAPGDQKRRLAEPLSQRGHDGGPGLVGLRGRRRRFAASYAVRLLDERRSKAELARFPLGAHEIGRRHPTARAMAENQESLRLAVRLPKMGPRRAVRRLDLDRVHVA